MKMTIIESIKEATIKGDAKKTEELVNQAISEGLEINDILQNGLIGAMAVVGENFKQGQIFVPEMLIAARAMQYGLKLVKPLLIGDAAKGLATVVIGTVKGDLHDIGKSLVGMMVEGAGCKLIDLGVDVPVEKFIQSIQEHKPQFLCLSALLTTTMPVMSAVLEGLEQADLRDQVKVLVGGAPITQRFADEIGADGFASDAASAVDKIKELLAS